ncbi:MAG: prepilin-type N-terminal cleavage/methylation protein [Caloramator sp.]|uniref:PulJ/GspJ family protein n=1 Tax=Caloramator sp. TaxID=1871330 RepID=UPI001D2516F9|nr:prepilin-type N-terminal cleavage/methylation domain-containing protein [Caloramator sp.]MBZ4664302.1 prepilin-type N-terminal cleavage/methylation protein [Caloramator sp.]
MKRRKGYTLVELLVAFAIFAILIVPVSGMINTAIRGNKSSKEKLELVNIFNYAYESYLNGDVKFQDNNFIEIDYMDNKHKIKFEKVNQAEYQMKGIDYNSYDLVLKVDGNELQLLEGNKKLDAKLLEKEKRIENREKVKNRVFIKVTSEKSAFKYEIKINKIRENDDETFTTLPEEVLDKTISNPSGKLLIDVNNTDYNINFLIDGVYNGNGLEDRILAVDYKNKPSNVNLASVYPNVEFIEETATNSLDKNQRVEYVKISIFKNSDLNNPLNEKIYEFSKIQK